MTCIKHKETKKQRNRGFTLIELLVVISIIGLLSSVVFAATNAAREKAKVAVFVQELRQLQLAMELYKADKGYYPLQKDGDEYFLIMSGSNGLNDEITEPLKDADFIPKYISRIPSEFSVASRYPEIQFANEGGLNFIRGEYESTPSETCAGNPLKGYAFLVSAYDINLVLPLPILLNSDGSLFGSPFGGYTPYNTYCLTGN